MSDETIRELRADLARVTAERDAARAARDALIEVVKHASHQLWRMEYSLGDGTRGGQIMESLERAIAAAGLPAHDATTTEDKP